MPFAANRSLPFCARSVICALFWLGCCLALASSVLAQNRPDVVWMRGGHSDRVSSVAYSADGQTLLSAGDGLVKVWRVADRTPVRSFTAHLFTRQLALSPDAQTVATVGVDSNANGVTFGAFKLWRVSDGAQLHSITMAPEFTTVAFSPDGQTLATGGDFADPFVKLWRASDFFPLRTLAGSGSVVSVVFSPDGLNVASAWSDRTIRLWRVSDGAPLRTITTGHSAEIQAIAYAPDGQTLVSVSGASSDNVKLWRVSDGALLRDFVGHTSSVRSVAFAPGGQTLATGGNDVIKLWRVSGGAPLSTVAASEQYVWSLAYAPDGQTLASAGERIINLRSPVDGSLIAPLTVDAGYPAVYSPDGQIVATVAFSTGRIRLWRASDGKLLHTLTTFASSIAFSPDGQTLASGGDGPNFLITLWNVADGSVVRTFPTGHTNRIRGLAFTPDGQTLATGSNDRTIKLWRVSDGGWLRTLSGHTGAAGRIAIAPDGLTLASGSHDNTAKLWRISDGALLRTFTGHIDGIEAIAFSPDGQTVATGSYDQTIKLWNVSTGLLRRTLTGGRSGPVVSLAFTPDGLTLASGQYLVNLTTPELDTPLKFWRVSDGALLLTYDQETTRLVGSIAFSPDGRRFAYARYDATTVVSRNPFGPPSATVSGIITLEDLVPTAAPQSLTLTFRPSDNSGDILKTVSVGSDGAFSVTDLPRKNYTLHIKGSKWLAKNVAMDASNGDVSNVNATLPAGDANDDNSVDVLDLDTLIQAFDSTSGDVNWNNGVADFNGDESVDVLDLDLLLRNFDRQGDP